MKGKSQEDKREHSHNPWNSKAGG